MSPVDRLLRDVETGGALLESSLSWRSGKQSAGDRENSLLEIGKTVCWRSGKHSAGYRENSLVEIGKTVCWKSGKSAGDR